MSAAFAHKETTSTMSQSQAPSPPSNYKSMIVFIKAISGQANTLTIPRVYVDLVRSHRAALLLSQCVYWTDKSDLDDGWFYKTFAEWKKELGIPRCGIETAMKRLGRWIETDIRKVGQTPKTHYRVNFETLARDVSDLLDSSKSEVLKTRKSDLLENSKTPTRKITVSETTPPTARRAAPPPAPKVPAEVLQVYESNIGLATAVILDDLEKAVNDYTDAWVIEALKETARARVKRLSYALKILESWKRDGFKADHASPNTPAPNGNTTNPRLHPAIAALHKITGRYPRKEVQDQLIRVIGDNPNVGDLQRCFDAWTIKGWRADNFTWVTEWYISGIPATDKSKGGKGTEPVGVDAVMAYMKNRGIDPTTILRTNGGNGHGD